MHKGNRPVAMIVPLSRRRRWLPAAEVIRELARLGPDSTRSWEELRETLTETTDDLRSRQLGTLWLTTCVFIGFERALNPRLTPQRCKREVAQSVARVDRCPETQNVGRRGPDRRRCGARRRCGIGR